MTTETTETTTTAPTGVQAQPSGPTPEKPQSAGARGSLQGYFDDVDQWFDDLRRQWLQPLMPRPQWLETSQAFGGRMPRVDLIDRDQEFLVRAELPGVSKDNLELSLQENTLLLRATCRSEEQEERGQYFRQETSRGEFQRVIRLPGPVDADQARASFRDGVLELVLPKKPGTQRRSIPVE